MFGRATIRLGIGPHSSSISITVEAPQGKMCQNSLPSGRGKSLGAKISGEAVIPGEYFLVSTKLDTLCYLTVQTAPGYIHSTRTSQTDRTGQTDNGLVA